MSEKDETATGMDALPTLELDSRFRLVVVAALRSKQLLRGATPRIDANPLRRRNTSIALEEARQGLVPYALTVVKQEAVEDAESGRTA